MNSLVTGLARHGAEVSPATLAGTCAQAGALLAPLAEAITARSRDSWHLHADETTWRVFAPREARRDPAAGAVVAVGVHRPRHRLLRDGPDPVRGGAGPARRDRRENRAAVRGRGRRAAAAGHLQRLLRRVPARRGRRPTAWSTSTAGRTSAGTSSGPGTPTPTSSTPLDRRVAGPDQEPVRRPRGAHGRLAGHRRAGAAPRDKAAAAARLDEAYAAWDTALTVIDETRTKQMAAPGLQEPGEEGARHAGPGMGRAGRAPRLPDDQPGQQRRPSARSAAPS